MTNINSLLSILEYGSTCIRLAIYDKIALNKNLFFEEKVDFTRIENYSEDQIISDIIKKAEKELGQHLNEIILMVDNPSIFSLDFCIQKNFEKNIIKKEDIDYLINECKIQVKINNMEKDILHIIKSNLYFDDKLISETERLTQTASKVVVETKFILIDKKFFQKIRDLFIKKHISLKSFFCISYIKSLGYIKKLEITGYNSFIDIGLNKSSLTIFKDSKLLYINNIHIGGDHITKDISKILNINYRTAESKKLKFFKKNLNKGVLNEDELLKKIINSRLEEIIEILFLNCPLVRAQLINSNLKLFFLGNGSKVLNENLLSFGSELKFINEMTIIDEKNFDCCNSAVEFNASHMKIQPKKTSINLENKGFFEKLFEYFSK